MKILVACEWSGRVRDAFIRKGHDAYSCDYEPTAGEYQDAHIRGNVLDEIEKGWDMMIAFPPCTYLTNAAYMHHDSPGEERSLAFVQTLMDADIPRIAIENPPGAINRLIRREDQIIHPWWFGEPYKKATCLWLKNLPLLTMGPNWEHPDLCTPWVNSKRSQGYGHRDPKMRGMTFRGIAEAMATQWGNNE